MGADKVDVARRHAAAIEQLGHHRELAVFRRLRQVIRVGVGLDPQHFGVDPCAAPPRGFEFLDDQRRPAVGRHEAFTPQVEWTTGARRIVVERLVRNRPHQRHRMQVDGGKIEDGAEHHASIDVVMPDFVERVAQRDIAAGAGAT